MPLVVANEIEATSKTKDALALLKVIKAMEDVDNVKDSRKIRRGTGKMRNRRYVERKGPLLVYANNNGIEQGFRNIPGVEIACVDRLNLLKLAPGGHLGRFVIWTQAAFEKLDSTFGTYTAASDVKKTFALPRTMMSNADLARIINSDEIQTKVRAAREGFAKPSRKRNALTNLGTMLKLNPYVGQVKRAETAAAEAGAAKKRKLTPTTVKAKGKKGKDVKKTARAAKDAKLVMKANFAETMRATPDTPMASFLDSYNKIEDAMDKPVKSKK